MDKESKAYKSGEFCDIFNEAELDNMVADVAVAYSESQLRLEDDLAALDYRYDQGEAEGLRKGKEEGLRKGKAEGLRLTATNMLKAGMDFGFIHEITGLPIEEIQKLKTEIN